MSNLSYIEQRNFEKLFDMNTWYIANFSNKTFWDFVIDSIWVDPYSWDYDSKANLLRKIIKEESNYKVWKLLLDMVDYFEIENGHLENLNISLINKCKEIADNLKDNSKIDNLNISNIEKDKTLDLLLNEIEYSKEKENPENILDRLHTLATKFIRQLSKKHNINTDKKSLNWMFWLYVKELEKKGLVESDITLLIVKSNISILEKFNYIRNNQSLAHDNEILNSDESIFIINNIINLLHFIDKLEKNNIEDLPF